jgi:tetratricopeptide (TPR) repeat protein
MQVAISDPAAIGCAREFYRALADGYPIEGAVASARQAIRGAREAYELEWATPALYLRATDGQLWNMAPLSAEARTQKRWQSLRRLAREAERRRDMPSAIRHWQELAALAERLPAGTEANNRIRDLQDAETYYARGLELYQAGDWQGAYDCFREQLNRRGGRDGNVLGLLEETRGKLRDPAKNRPVRLDAHIKKVVAELADRQVVIFLGSDVNVTGRTDLTRWSKGQLPTGTELARYLVGVGPHAYPREDEADLGRVAQWVDTFGIQGEVYDAIRDKLEVAFPATPLHHVLASRLPELRDPDAPNHPLIVVTATLDDGLEFALDRADEPYELVAYRARENGRRPLFEHRSFESDGPTPIEDATRYVEIPRDPAVRVLLVKIHGGFDRRGGRKDSFVVTEDDYLDYSRHISRLLPKGLTDLLRDKYFLFLGYSLQDWSLRVFLHALKDEVWGDRDRGKPAWAVQAEPSDLDRRLWERWGVGLVEAPLDLYVAALRAEVEARLA